MEADRISFRTSVATNYHKDYVGTFYGRLLRMEQEHQQKKVPLLSGLSDALATHPPSAERVAQIQQLEAETRLNKNAVVSTKEFDRVKKIAWLWTRQNSEG